MLRTMPTTFPGRLDLAPVEQAEYAHSGTFAGVFAISELLM